MIIVERRTAGTGWRTSPRPAALTLAAPAALLLSLCPPAATGAPQITEFMAINQGTLDDGAGRSSDWIEIYNPGPAPLELMGWHLTDDPAAPEKWPFPQRELGSGAYLVVFASGDGVPDAGGSLHTNFALDGAGDYLALTGPGGAVEQDFGPRFPGQLEDISFGSLGDGDNGYFRTPTPGAANGPGVLGFVADTRFSVKRGFFDAPISVEITTATEGAQIYYTTNGIEPTIFSLRYTVPVRVSRTTILRAMAVKQGFERTNVDTQTYLFPADIIEQPDMSPTVVNSSLYRDTIEGDLASLPALSIVVDNDEFFGRNGIHTNPDDRGRQAEVPISLEFFNLPEAEGAGAGFQAEAGIRVHGGNARSHPKKPFRLYFRSDYGTPRLRFPLFPGSPVEEFDQLVLRGGGHDAWSVPFGHSANDLATAATYLRDEFLRRTEVDMGLLSPRGRFVQLFINGRYWGLYNIHERAAAAFFASHLGGDEADYDVLKHGDFLATEVLDGNRDAWDEMLDVADRAGGSSPAYAEIQEFLDLDTYSDAMISRIWSGDHDWLGPVFLDGDPATAFNNKNWYGGRRSRNGPGVFHFFTWDAEISMGSNLFINFPNRILDFDLTRVDDTDSPAHPYDRLRGNREFRIRFADRLQRHFTGEGEMTPARNRARWDDLVSTIERAVVTESARWGLVNGPPPYTRNLEWRSEVNWIRNTFLGQRTSIVLGQFRDIGLFPDFDAPTFSRPGGPVAPGALLSLSSGGEEGTIYYTTDGSDPRQQAEVETIEFIGEDTEVFALIPSTDNGGRFLGSTWTGTGDPFGIENWRTGTNGVGYERTPADYAQLIHLRVDEMDGENTSAFIRIPFQIEDASELNRLGGLTLRMRYDDGFVAYLNGVEVRRANAPGTLAWDSASTDNHSDNLARSFEDFDLSNHRHRLRTGKNVLAIHGLNDGLNSSDFLIEAGLRATGTLRAEGPSPAATAYGGPFPLDSSATVRMRLLTPGGDWSTLVERRYLVGVLASRQNLVITEIHYRPSPPSTAEELAAATSRTDFEFIELMNIGAEAIDLTDVAFTAGVTFSFTGSAITRLDPGARVLVVKNTSAFTARYGPGATALIAGEFANDTRLDNNGERIVLSGALGAVIQEFRYNDRSPWPESPDGDGLSLVLRNPLDAPDAGEAASWRASTDLGGSPGGGDHLAFADWHAVHFDAAERADPAVSGDAADPDRDGLSNLLEYAAASDPRSTLEDIGGPVAPRPGTLREPAGAGIDEALFLTLTFRQRLDDDDLTFAAESSDDLVTWTPLDLDLNVIDEQVDPTSGTATRTVRDPDPIPAVSGARRFIRLRVTRRP